MFISGQQAAIIALAVVAVVAAIGWLFRKDQEQETRLKGYSELAAWLKEAKLQHAADVFLCLSVKDFSGAAKGVWHLVKLLTTDPKQRLALLDENFLWQLERRVGSPEDWAKIIQVVDARKAALTAK